MLQIDRCDSFSLVKLRKLLGRSFRNTRIKNPIKSRKVVACEGFQRQS